MSAPLEPTQETLWRTLHSVSEWVKFADAKAGATLALAAAMLALLSARLRESPKPPISTMAGLYAAAALAGLSALFAIWTVLPRVKKLGSSPIHYGTIARYASGEQFNSAVLTVLADPHAVNNALSQHIWTISRAATRKYGLVTWSIRFLAAALLTSVVAVL